MRHFILACNLCLTLIAAAVENQPAIDVVGDLAAVPDGHRTVSAYLVLADASKAIDFYIQAFGARVALREPEKPGAPVEHAELVIGDSLVMLADETPNEAKHGLKPLDPKAPRNSFLVLYVQDVDAVIKRAVAQGAVELDPASDRAWGDRLGVIKDPFGTVWYVITNMEAAAKLQPQTRQIEPKERKPSEFASVNP
jgi:PhnB protein